MCGAGCGGASAAVGPSLQAGAAGSHRAAASRKVHPLRTVTWTGPAAAALLMRAATTACGTHRPAGFIFLASEVINNRILLTELKHCRASLPEKSMQSPLLFSVHRSHLPSGGPGLVLFRGLTTSPAPSSCGQWPLTPRRLPPPEPSRTGILAALSPAPAWDSALLHRRALQRQRRIHTSKLKHVFFSVPEPGNRVAWDGKWWRRTDNTTQTPASRDGLLPHVSPLAWRRRCGGGCCFVLRCHFPVPRDSSSRLSRREESVCFRAGLSFERIFEGSPQPGMLALGVAAA